MKGKLTGKLLIGILLCASVLIGAKLGYDHHCKTAEADSHNEIRKYIDEGLSFESGKLEKEEAELQGWLGTPHVSDSDRGLLYERLSNVYRFQGRTLDYYEVLGYALYYLKKGGDTSTAANICADLANYFITNNCYGRAQEMMDEIYNLVDVDQMENLQIRSYIYRLQAILDIHEGKFESAGTLLRRSRETVDRSHTSFWESAYYAMIDVQSARVLFELHDYDGAQKIIDDYADSTMFTDQAYANIVARDFIIPYYEVACRLAARTQENKVAKPLIDSFVACCEQFGFYKIEIDTLLYLLEYLPPKTAKERDEIYAIINRAYLVQTDMQAEEYSGLISGQLQESIAQKQQEDRQRLSSRHQLFRIFLYMAVCAVILLFLSTAIRESLTDGLTGIHNRRAFNQHVNRLRKKRATFGIIMIDIDNFKRVNDTYGHPTGDIVLQKLALILRSVQTKELKCYRYGGEEFVLVSLNTDVPTMVAVAERVRKEMAAQTWEFGETVTISLGVAVEHGGIADCGVVDAADQNLYYSKNHGKNTVSYSQDGTVYTTREEQGTSGTA